MKGTLKRVMSGVLSVITIASAVAQPITAYAAEPEKAASSFEAQYPELETVKDKLAEDEILIANDYSIDYGSDFDINSKTGDVVINFHNKKLNDFLFAWGVIRGKRARGLISDEEYLNWKYQIQI